MDIVKNLKDYDLSQEQKIFAAFIKENVGSMSCYEKIVNTHHILDYAQPENDLTIYNSSIPCIEPRRLMR